MTYKSLPKFTPNSPQIYARIDDDGVCRVTCSEDNTEFQAWLADGNTPLPADE